MTITSKPFGHLAEVDIDLFGLPCPRSDREILDKIVQGLNEDILESWKRTSEESLGAHFHDELGGAEGVLSEFGHHYDVLEREGMWALAIKALDRFIKIEIEFWDSQH